MKRTLYAIYDTKAGDIIGIPMIHNTEKVAVRDFADIVLHPNSQVGRHHEDYVFVQLGHLNLDNLTDAGPDLEAHLRIVVTATTIVEAAKAAQQAHPEQRPH